VTFCCGNQQLVKNAVNWA